MLGRSSSDRRKASAGTSFLHPKAFGMGAFLARLFHWRRVDAGGDESSSCDSDAASVTDGLIPHSQASPLHSSPLGTGGAGYSPIQKLPPDLVLR